MSDEFEKLIEARLQAELGPLVRSATPPPHRFSGSPRSAALLTTRTLAMTMAALLAIGGGFIAATAATGSPSPAEWTLQVKAVVTQCRTAMAPGERGVGHCVSDQVEQAQSTPPASLVPPPTSQPTERPAVEPNHSAAPTLVHPEVTESAKPAAPAVDGTNSGDHQNDENRTGGGEGPPDPGHRDHH